MLSADPQSIAPPSLLDVSPSNNSVIQQMEEATDPEVVTEVEDNNTLATATALPFPLPEDPPGSGLFIGRGIGSIQPSSDQDY